MSELLKDNRHFIDLILYSTQVQAEALLDTASKSQIRVIAQLARNLLIMPLDEENTLDCVSTNNKFLAKLADEKNSIPAKGVLISKRRRKVIEIFRTCRVLVEEAVEEGIKKSKKKSTSTSTISSSADRHPPVGEKGNPTGDSSRSAATSIVTKKEEQ